MKSVFQITAVSTYQITNPKTGNVQNRVRVTGIDSKGVEVKANVTALQFSKNNPGDTKNYQGGTATVDFYDKGDELVGNNICTESGKIVRDISCTMSMQAMIAQNVGERVFQSLGLGGVPNTHVTIQGQSVPAPAEEEEAVHAEMMKEEDGDI